MRISTESLNRRVGALAGLEGVDPRALTGDEAMAWLTAGGQARQALDAVLAAVASRVEELSTGEDRTKRFARTKGFSDVGALVTEVAGVPRAEAGRMVTLGQAMADADAGSGGNLTVGARESSEGPLPLYGYLTQEVARGNGFTAEKATIIRQVLSLMSNATPELERSLVERARKRTAPQVRVMCLTEFERTDHDGYRAHVRAKASRRFLKMWDGDDGLFHISGALDPVKALPLRTLIEDHVRNGMHSQRDVPPAERLEPEQLAADALTDLAIHRLGCQGDASGPKSTIVIQVEAKTLATGKGAAIAHGHVGPICVEDLATIAIDAQLQVAVMGANGLPLFLGRSQRYFSPSQRLAIALRDKGCAKCGAPVARCHVHHISFWSNDGPTDIDNGVLLCSGCHHRLHDFGWDIEIIAGEVWFVPPAQRDPQRRRIPACSTRSPITTG